MYNNPYEDYMRNSLGYGTNPLMGMNMNTSGEMYEDENAFTCNQLNVDNMYPEIYRIIYPMVVQECMNIQENITDDLVSRITDNIYRNVESTETLQENRSTISNSSSRTTRNETISNRTNNSTTNTLSNNNVSPNSNNYTRQESRVNNPLLRDLIRILVLREIIGNPTRPRPPFRPPFRPQFGGGPNQRVPYQF